jgi:arginyl-tRNA synthetase
MKVKQYLSEKVQAAMIAAGIPAEHAPHVAVALAHSLVNIKRMVF